MSNIDAWNLSLATAWSEMVPPTRPSIAEINIYTKYLRNLQLANPEKHIKLLILGSTVEFRDWAFEQDLDCAVADASKDYYRASSNFLRHPKITKVEKMIEVLWQEMDFNSQFDFIVGDSLVQNIPTDKLSDFIKAIHNSLKPNGLFISKGFFQPKNYQIQSVEEIYKNYETTMNYLHPSEAITFDLVMTLTNPKTRLFRFADLISVVEKMSDLSPNYARITEAFYPLKAFGQTNSHFIPDLETWLQELGQYFSKNEIIIENNYDQFNQKYSKDFPLFICKK
jgi:cyclopropane fatty-acyl-phospholipid synthase-like methyltransferase